MKYITLILATLLITGCATNGGNFFDPEVVGGNERFVVIHDPFGIPGKSQAAAESHCSTHGRYAQFQSMGGNAFQCTHVAYCQTYVCTN